MSQIGKLYSGGPSLLSANLIMEGVTFRISSGSDPRIASASPTVTCAYILLILGIMDENSHTYTRPCGDTG